MTRINVVPVEELCNKHLLAEYRELPRVFKLARPCHDAPKQYTLGAGHVKFFYDKLGWLLARQRALVNEMTRRGFKPTHTASTLMDKAVKAEDWQWKTYTPTPEALALNRARIVTRISEFKVPLKAAKGS